MPRYYLQPDAWEDTSLTLTGGEARHCTRVMRAKAGQTIEIFDGHGNAATCQITGIGGKDTVQCHITSRHHQPPPTHPVTLCQAIPKGGNMELIVQKAVELGTSAIQPLITAHTVARPDAAAKKRAKWQRTALEACKQCGQNHLPDIREPIPFTRWITAAPPSGTRLIAALDEHAIHLRHHFAANPPAREISLLIGPEGDFSPAEYQAAYQAGYQPITFGNITLRVETAAIYGLSILQHELTCS